MATVGQKGQKTGVRQRAVAFVRERVRASTAEVAAATELEVEEARICLHAAARAGLVILLEGRGKKAVWGPGPGEMTATRMKRPAVAPPSAPVPDVEALIVRMLAADDTKLERIERILGAVA